MKKTLLLCAMLATTTAGICGQIDPATLQTKTATVAIKEAVKPVEIDITPKKELYENSVQQNTPLADVTITGQNAERHRLAVWFTDGIDKQAINNNDATLATITEMDSESTLSVKLAGEAVSPVKDDVTGKTILLTDDSQTSAAMHVVSNGESAVAGSYLINLSAGEWAE